jgi:hypothetical protein
MNYVRESVSCLMLGQRVHVVSSEKWIIKDTKTLACLRLELYIYFQLQQLAAAKFKKQVHVRLPIYQEECKRSVNNLVVWLHRSKKPSQGFSRSEHLMSGIRTKATSTSLKVIKEML